MLNQPSYCGIMILQTYYKGCAMDGLCLSLCGETWLYMPLRYWYIYVYHGYYGLMRAEHSTALLLQEECDVLILVLSKNTEPIALSDFRAVMLATLRLVAGMLGLL